jgi:hypothetical protein
MDDLSTLAERVFAVDRRGTTIQAGDLVLHRGRLHRVVSLETTGEVLVVDGAGTTSAVPASELELVL